QGASVSITAVQLLANDSDPQNQPLTVVAVSEPGTEGVLTGDTATGFAYTPSTDPSLIDTEHTLNYLVTDTDGHVAQSDIIVRILANGDPNRPPVAVPDTASTTGAPVNVFTTVNDFDPDGDAIGVVSVANPPHGTVVNFGSGFGYTPNAGFSGTETVFYTLRDAHGLTSIGLATVLVNAGPQPPVAVSNSYTVTAGGSLSITLSAVDPEGQPLAWSFVTTPAGILTGSLTGAAPTLTYTAPATPMIDSFIFEVSDGALTAQGTIVITVTRANIAPVAVDDVAATTQETPKAIDVLANDTDADHDTLAISSATGATHGQVSCTPVLCTYTPEPGFFGTDSFTYTITDGFSGADEGAVAVTVSPSPISASLNPATLTTGPGATSIALADIPYERMRTLDVDVSDAPFAQ